jgi:hypothetical protein
LFCVSISIANPIGEEKNSAISKIYDYLSNHKIYNVSRYEFLGNTIEATGNKYGLEDIEGMETNRSTIMEIIKPGIEDGVLSPDYDKSDDVWTIHELSNMTKSIDPSGASSMEDYMAIFMSEENYYVMPVRDFDIKQITKTLAQEFTKSKWPIEMLAKNIENILPKKTPIYVNDIMFITGNDFNGQYIISVIGLNRYGLTGEQSEGGSVINLSKANLNMNTIIHESLHDKIRTGSTTELDMQAEYYGDPLFGLRDEWVDEIKVAFKIREVLNNQDNANKVIGGAYSEKNTLWWEPLASKNMSTYYYFTRDKKVNKNNISQNQRFEVDQYMEEFLVRVITNSLRYKPKNAVANVLNEVPGLLEAFSNDGKALASLENFVKKYYGLVSE